MAPRPPPDLERLTVRSAATDSILDLLHPRGHAESVRVFGGACLTIFNLCPGGRVQTTGAADLVVVAPSALDLAKPGWLEQTVPEAAACLRPGGLLYALAYGNGRRAMARLLKACGLSVVDTVLHHPGWADAQTLAPVKRPALAYAYTRLIRTNPIRRRIALDALRLPGALPLVRRLLPTVGLLAQHPGDAAPATWLTEVVCAARDRARPDPARPDRARPDLSGFENLTGLPNPPQPDAARPDLSGFENLTGLPDRGARIDGVVLNSSWRGPEGAVLLHAVDGRGEPVAIAKTWFGENGEDAVAREARGLTELAAPAGAFGVAVPALLGRGHLGRQPYLVESAVAGERASVRLHNRPAQLAPLLSQLTEWLAAWKTANRQPTLLTRRLLDEHLLHPALELMPDLKAKDYVKYLEALAARLEGTTMPLVPVHGDLTMVNVLVARETRGGRLRLGVIDWETARAAWLPLVDFFYTVVDAVAALKDYRDRPAAYKKCFAPGGQHVSLVAGLQARLVDALALTPDQVALSFHASWLSFALDERRETAKIVPDEFLRIARMAANAAGSTASASLTANSLRKRTTGPTLP